MLVFSFAVEVDILDAKADSYNDVLQAAAKAYRQRAACWKAKGEAKAAERDVQRAEKLEAKRKTADEKSKAAVGEGKAASQVTVHNGWGEPVTLVIAGVPHVLQAGETKTLAAPSGSFSYEMQAGPHRSKGTIAAGQTYNIGAPSSPSP
jgi:hypothetical protein